MVYEKSGQENVLKTRVSDTKKLPWDHSLSFLLFHYPSYPS